jgi:uncharacterized membrane protein
VGGRQGDHLTEPIVRLAMSHQEGRALGASDCRVSAVAADLAAYSEERLTRGRAEATVMTSVDQLEATPADEARSEGWRRWFRWFHYTLPGVAVAVVFVCLSFTPSLLPRSWVVQGVVCGISGAIGYGLGVLGAWVWRAFADRDARPARSGAWRILLVVGAVAVVISFVLGQRWQAQIRDLMGVPGPGIAGWIMLPVVTVVLFVLIIAMGRGLRAAYRWTSRQLNRWIGPRAARAVGWALVVGVTYAVASGVLIDGFVSVANETFSVRNTITAEGVVQPGSPLRSGGPGSLVSWDSLGREGRKFAGTGPSTQEIAAYTGSAAQQPIRAYAGLDSADDAEARARLAVDDLERAGGFERANLLISTTTGSGWLDPASIDTFEYLTGGDSAAVGMQYSYLPSWISFLVDQEKAREAGRELYDAVYDRWSRLAPAQRPKLFVFGESLGSFGGETAFSGEYDLRNRTAGTLFAGPPAFNTLYRDFTDDRDAGSKEVAPIYRAGRTVRFDDDPKPGVEPASAPWDGTRVLYLQHASDPIVWWSPNLLLNRPAWLREPAGRDVLDEMVWLPFVTFWQVTLDLPFATGVPGGHGHKYTTEYVDAWATVMQPPGWTEDKADRLRNIIQAAG